MNMEIQTPEGLNLTVGKKLAENPGFNLYECDTGDGRKCFLKIASSADKNPSLDREAFLLQTMSERARLLEEEYSKHKTDKNVMLNYQFYFPSLIESFICEEQEGRRVNLLGFFEIAKEVNELVPLSLVLSHDRQRVDPRTSAWIMGKLLKMLDFLHVQGISGEALDTGNILINRERHLVCVFDWSQATIAPIFVSTEIASSEVAEAALSVIEVLGGDRKKFTIPDNEQLTDTRYTDFLKNLASGNESNAGKAHKEFYELVWGLWSQKLHPYTTHRL